MWTFMCIYIYTHVCNAFIPVFIPALNNLKASDLKGE